MAGQTHRQIGDTRVSKPRSIRPKNRFEGEVDAFIELFKADDLMSCILIVDNMCNSDLAT